MKLSALFLVVALSVAAVGSAALTQIDFTRDTAGTVLSDTASNVAVKFTAVTDYEAAVDEAANGEIAIDLNDAFAAVTNQASNGFNPNAVFTVGDGTGIYTITNNSDSEIIVTLEQATTGLTMSPIGGDNTLLPGDTTAFSFTIDTNGKAKDAPLTGKVTVAATGN